VDPVATTLGAIELVDEGGRTIRAATLWAERPVVLLFVRHFG